MRMFPALAHILGSTWKTTWEAVDAADRFALGVVSQLSTFCVRPRTVLERFNAMPSCHRLESGVLRFVRWCCYVDVVRQLRQQRQNGFRESRNPL